MREVAMKGILDVINEADNLDISEYQVEENLSDLGMDSIAFIQIVVKLEEAFDCEIPDDKLLISEMDSVQKIYNVLQDLYQKQSV